MISEIQRKILKNASRAFRVLSRKSDLHIRVFCSNNGFKDFSLGKLAKKRFYLVSLVQKGHTLHHAHFFCRYNKGNLSELSKDVLNLDRICHEECHAQIIKQSMHKLPRDKSKVLGLTRETSAEIVAYFCTTDMYFIHKMMEKTF